LSDFGEGFPPEAEMLHKKIRLCRRPNADNFEKLFSKSESRLSVKADKIRQK